MPPDKLLNPQYSHRQSRVYHTVLGIKFGIMFPVQPRKMFTASPETLGELYRASSLIPCWVWACGVLLCWDIDTVCLHVGPSFGVVSHLLLELSVLRVKLQMNL